MFAQHNHSMTQLSGHVPVIENYMAANCGVLALQI